jgi:fibronectin type 3 domain-containing protein
MKVFGFLIATLILAASSFGQSQPSHSVALTWTAPTGGSTVSGYNAYRGTTKGGPYTVLNTAAVAVTNYTDTSALVEGTTYFYVVTSVGPGGESVASNEASALIPLSKPLPPSNLTSTPK